MINIQNMSFGYDNLDALFKKINLNLKTNNVCGLLGKNGSGKTTLLKLIAGLLFPKIGRCMCDIYDVTKRLPTGLENIYFVPEEFYLPELSAKNYLKLYSPFYRNFDNALFERYTNEFDIDNNKVLTTLSYGQKKKFLISFALATNAKLILFDEPTNGLDIPSKSQFRKLIASSMSEEKLFIISTHQVHDVEKLVDRVVIIDNGEIILNESTIQIANKISFTQQSSEPR
ncbi:MAG: ABC transporter ATP-binding protein, partial [Gammaproteobacteria bacterium]|nr:ABC transporter ATP-binding protein [Gammaproteobacteria bacterium]